MERIGMEHDTFMKRRERPSEVSEGDLVTVPAEDKTKIYRVLYIGFDRDNEKPITWIGPPSLSGDADMRAFTQDLENELLNQEKYRECRRVSPLVLQKVSDA